MKTQISMIAAALTLVASSFAVAQTAPATGPAPGAKLTSAEYKAAKKQVSADEKMAKAECKKLSGDQKSACKKEAEAKEKMSMADLKARK